VVDVLGVDSGHEDAVAFLNLDVVIIVIVVVDIHKIGEVFQKAVRLLQ
jgi:hypothetical protein